MGNNNQSTRVFVYVTSMPRVTVPGVPAFTHVNLMDFVAIAQLVRRLVRIWQNVKESVGYGYMNLSGSVPGA